MFALNWALTRKPQQNQYGRCSEGGGEIYNWTFCHGVLLAHGLHALFCRMIHFQVRITLQPLLQLSHMTQNWKIACIWPGMHCTQLLCRAATDHTCRHTIDRDCDKVIHPA